MTQTFVSDKAEATNYGFSLVAPNNVWNIVVIGALITHYKLDRETDCTELLDTFKKKGFHDVTTQWPTAEEVTNRLLPLGSKTPYKKDDGMIGDVPWSYPSC